MRKSEISEIRTALVGIDPRFCVNLRLVEVRGCLSTLPAWRVGWGYCASFWKSGIVFNAWFFPAVLVLGGWNLRLDGVAVGYPFGGVCIFYGTGWGGE
ncbi:hypothetical protein [Corynebacterium mustelae]|uniref:hypothetical protein n=1 Tax=Corynebacterium mustelae TaxID=571915 RepID=UPI00130E8C34|nr:hypothetical protein [Corynebacterium mustelae]